MVGIDLTDDELAVIAIAIHAVRAEIAGLVEEHQTCMEVFVLKDVNGVVQPLIKKLIAACDEAKTGKNDDD